MTVHLHDYGPMAAGAGGAPINYSEISRLLLADASLGSRAHDFHALLAAGEPDPLGRLVRDGDTLVCNVGPYAQLYHCWRERSGRDFRIIRDARTTAWGPYLAQEWLGGPLVRDGDIIIFPSEFARSFYQRAFAHINDSNSRVLYPLAGRQPPARPRTASGELRIGCLGRIADDKNISDAMRVVARLRRHRPAVLHLAGPFYPASREVGSPADLINHARSLGLPATALNYHGNLSQDEIWDFLAGIDVLFFPAVSSNESFGRVIAEAGHAGVPVIASDYAAAHELLPPENLVPVHYHAVHRARLSMPLSLGTPDIERSVEALLSAPSASNVLTELRYSRDRFLTMLAGNDQPDPPAILPSPGSRWFLDNARLEDIRPLSRAEALGYCATQLRFMQRLHGRSLAGRLWAVAQVAPHLPGDAMLRRVARERLHGSAAVGLLRNAVAPGRLLGFDPRLSLDGSRQP